MISFDVFDTCLVRTLAHPSDLYVVLAENLLGRRDAGVNREMIVELANLRMDAYALAQEISTEEEVSLEEIYRCLDLDGWPISKQEMSAEEIRLEAESVRPVARIKSEIELLRKTGEPITFISDTPLPSHHVRSLLEEHSIAKPGDRIYTSSEVGLRKSSGRLFQYVREDLSPTDWKHRGDHPVADAAMPRQLGIRTEPYLDSKLNRYERMVVDGKIGSRSVRSRIAGVSRATRLMSDVDIVRFPALASVATNVVGPLLTCFVAWLLQDAVRTGVDRLYFVSRDGEILLEIAERLKQYMPAPECRYLYGSRQAWLLAATTEVNREEVAWIFNDSVKPTELLAKLGLRRDEASSALQGHGFDITEMSRPFRPGDSERFWQMLRDPDVADLILQRVASARRDSLDYFRQEGLTDGSKWALVDVGWKLQSQGALRQLLNTVGMEDSINGYYLAVAGRRLPMRETGPYRALYMPEEFDEARTLHRHAVLIEQAFLPASHGSLLGYHREGDQITPVLRPTMSHPDGHAYQVALRHLISRYADEAARAGILNEHLHELKLSAVQAAHRLLTDPTREEVHTLTAMRVCEDLSDDPDRYRLLVKTYGLDDVMKRLADRALSMVRNGRGRGHGDTPHWIHGSKAISRPWILKLYRLASSSRLSSWLRRR